MDLKRLIGLTKEAATEQLTAATQQAAAQAREAEANVVAATQRAGEELLAAVNAVRDLPPIVTDGLLVASEHVYVGDGRVEKHPAGGPASEVLIVRGGMSIAFSRTDWGERGPVLHVDRSMGEAALGTCCQPFGSDCGGNYKQWAHRRYKVIVAFIPIPEAK